MKRINQLALTVTILLIVIVLIDLTINWIKHPVNNNTSLGILIAICFLILSALITIRYIIQNSKKN